MGAALPTIGQGTSSPGYVPTNTCLLFPAESTLWKQETSCLNARHLERAFVIVALVHIRLALFSFL